MGVPHQAANLGGDRLTPAPNAEAASWFADRWTLMVPSLPSLVPPVFEAYARVFHPARPRPVRRCHQPLGYPLERYRHV